MTVNRLVKFMDISDLVKLIEGMAKDLTTQYFFEDSH